jgi:hypothetical protein
LTVVRMYVLLISNGRLEIEVSDLKTKTHKYVGPFKPFHLKTE